MAVANARRYTQTVRVPLSAAADTAGAILAWANPEGVQVIVTRLILNITTFTSGACTIDAGVAADATTLNDGLIDGLNAATAAQIADNITNGGTNGKARQLLGATQFITASTASGNVAGLVGNAYISYIKV